MPEHSPFQLTRDNAPQWMFPWECPNCHSRYHDPELPGVPYVCSECGTPLRYHVDGKAAK